MYETGLSEMFVISFIIGMTGALAPGPMLIATITGSMRDGWKVGPRIAAGHMIIETIVVVVILVGFARLITPYSAYIAFGGGIALVFFGAMTLRSAAAATLAPGKEEAFGSASLAGIITSASNPYFWLWWLTIGAGFLLDGLKGGLLVVMAFLAGHWLADVGWFTFVSMGIAKGRGLFTSSMYRGVITACGIILVLFGLYYIAMVIPVTFL